MTNRNSSIAHGLLGIATSRFLADRTHGTVVVCPSVRRRRRRRRI